MKIIDYIKNVLGITTHTHEKNSECNEVDETGKETFPASDPPSWTPVSGVRRKGECKR